MIKKLFTLSIVIVTVILFLKIWGVEKKSRLPDHLPVISIKTDDTAHIPSPNRIGLNLGQWDSQEAQQYSTNVLKNPGFEGNIDRILVIVSAMDETSFSDEVGQGYPDNHWNGADFLIQTGPSAGRRGKVKRSLTSGKHGLPQYISSDPLHKINEGEIIVLTKETPPDLSRNWIASDPKSIAFDLDESHPSSPGKWTLRLSPQNHEEVTISYYLDAISDRAGIKFLPIKGKWRFSVWAKGDKPETELDISFKRDQTTFFHQKLSVNPEWAEYRIEFETNDEGPLAPLKLTLSSNHVIWIDDMWLGPQDRTFPFRQEVVDALKELNPSFLREFPHLGDTFENRIASPYRRMTWASRRMGRSPLIIYSYSLNEFLDLCEEVGTNPWLILPPIFSDDEAERFGKFLSLKADEDRFTDVIIEFGHENWNWELRPVGIPYTKKHSELSTTTLEKLAKGLRNRVNFRFFVNGQHSDPWTSKEYLQNIPAADGLAIAPYFFFSLNKGIPDEIALQNLFRKDPGHIIEIGNEAFSLNKDLAVYELNLHTTDGDAKGYDRNRIVAGAASGSALAKKILECMLAGADPIMVYNLAQYDTPAWRIDDDVKLWGIVRDFGPPVRFRPTGLAVMMLNEVINGDLYQPVGDAAKITIAIFKGKSSWSAAVVSEHDHPVILDVEFPDDQHSLPTSLLVLNADSPLDTNEEEEKVTILKQQPEVNDRHVKFVISAWGFAVLKQEM